MIALDPRLRKLQKIINLHDDPSVVPTVRETCRLKGESLAMSLGIEFSKRAIDRACGIIETGVEFARAAKGARRRRTAEAQETALKDAAERRERERAERQRDEFERQQRERAERRTAAKAKHKATMERKRAEEKARKQRLDRIKAGLEPPLWSDLNDDHLSRLDAIADLDLSGADRAFVERIRVGLCDGRYGIFGDALERMNELLRRAFFSLNSPGGLCHDHRN